MKKLEQLFIKAVELHGSGDPASALPLYREVAQTLPDADVVQYNFGLALYELGLFEEAIASFEAASATNPQDGDTWYNLGLAYRQAGDSCRAAEAYRRALELRPGDEEILHNLACAHMADDRLDEAAAAYEDLLAVNDAYLPGLNNLAYLRHLQGDFAAAGQLFARILELDPGHELARHMAAALEGEDTAAPPLGYVRDLFDQYSSYFDESLQERLAYQVPEEIKRLLTQELEQGRHFSRVLDLGCGTGLAGSVLRPLADRLEGVDISGGMLGAAREKGIYDALIQAEAVTFLAARLDPTWELIVAADVLAYLGDLAPLFAAVAARMPIGGLFCFSTESIADETWELQACGRYAHGAGYIAALAEERRLETLASRQAKVRQEDGQWIRGKLWLLQKVAG